MSDWKEKFESDVAVFKTLKRMFEAGAVEKLYDIKEIQPSRIADILGINKSRYALKLSRPETFSVSEILRLSYIIDIDPNLIINIIQKDSFVFDKLTARVNRNHKNLRKKKGTN